MGSDSERREPPRSKAELKAAMAKLLQEEHERELLDRKKALQDRRSNVGEGTSSITGKMLVPASPSPRKKARDGKLPNPASSYSVCSPILNVSTSSTDEPSPDEHK